MDYTVVANDDDPDNSAPCAELELRTDVAQDATLLLSALKSLQKDFYHHQRLEVRCSALERWPFRYYDPFDFDELLDEAEIKRCEVVEGSLIIKRPTGSHEGPASAFEREVQRHFEEALGENVTDWISALRNTGIFSPPMISKKSIVSWTYKIFGKKGEETTIEARNVSRMGGL